MTLDPQALSAAARAYCKVIGLDYDRISGPLAAKRDEATAAAITAYLETAFPPKMIKLTPEDERLLEKALMASTEVLYPIASAEAGWQDIDRMPFGEDFLAENRFGDWLTVRRFDPKKPGDYSSNAVINGRTGRWWHPIRWQPLPPPPVGSGQNLADPTPNPPYRQGKSR